MLRVRFRVRLNDVDESKVSCFASRLRITKLAII